jgi:hypothetical protein
MAVTGGEVNCAIEAHGNDRRAKGSPVGPDSGDPEPFGRFEHSPSLMRLRGNHAGVAESLVKQSHGFSNRHTPLYFAPLVETRIGALALLY